MIEKLPFNVDIEKLKNNLEDIKKIPVTWQAKEFGYKNFGGWSVLSRSGACDDGWETANALFQYSNNKPYKYHLAHYLKVSHPFEHINKTPACFGEIERIIDLLEEHGFFPRRARISLLAANTSSFVHSDAPWPEDNLIGNYICRIHVPIVTNNKCIHWTENGEFHMPADGSVYMLPVNNLHQIRNTSNEDRYHLIMDAYDTKGFTQTMKFDDAIEKLEKSAKQYRDRMDGTNFNFLHRSVFFIATHLVNLTKKYK